MNLTPEALELGQKLNDKALLLAHQGLKKDAPLTESEWDAFYCWSRKTHGIALAPGDSMTLAGPLEIYLEGHKPKPSKNPIWNWMRSF